MAGIQEKQPSKQLDRSLGFFSVMAISIGAMLGSGIFVLPGLAVAKTGPSVWLAYVIAGFCAFPAALSKAELSTAMPTSGGSYVYIDRAFGPYVSTVAGLGLWFSLLLKSAFALIGFGAYLTVLTDAPLKLVAMAMLAVIVILNVIGVGKVSKVQIVVMFIALGCLAALVTWGLPTTIQSEIFRDPQLPYGVQGLFATTAFVFVSYAGVTKAAAVAEEVARPERNLPLGIIASLVVVTIIYGLVVFVMTGNIPEETFVGTTRPVYELAYSIGGKTIGILGAILGVVTMVSMANSGLLASSRFPFAMSRDQLLPQFLGGISSKFLTPVSAVVLTGLTMAMVIFFLEVEHLAKLASAFVLLIYATVNLSVIILRESSPQWYKPAYRSPLYPFTQLFGIIASFALLSTMLGNALWAIASVTIPGTLLFAFYGRKRTRRMGELLKMGPRPELLTRARTSSSPSASTESSQNSVLVSLFGNERSPETIVEMGMALADERRLVVQHVTEIQESGLEEPALEFGPALRSLRRRLRAMSDDKNIPLEFSAIASRDVTKTVHAGSRELEAECLVLAWGGRVHLGRLLRNPLAWLISHIPCNLALFKDTGVRYFRKIMVYAEPGPHDSLVASTADHLATLFKAELTFVRFVPDNLEPTLFQSQVDYLEELSHLCDRDSQIRVIRGPLIFPSIKEETTYHDLLVIGAPPEKGLLGLLKTSKEDRITDEATCSVIQLRTPRLKTHAAFKPKKPEVTPRESTIQQALIEDCIETDLAITKKDALFEHFSQTLQTCVPECNAQTIEKALWDRENTQNTAVGHGLALPHATIENAPRTLLAVFTTARPMDYQNIGDEPVDIFFVTLGPPSGRQTHLELLSNVAQLVMETDLLDRLRGAESRAEATGAIHTCSNIIHTNET